MKASIRRTHASILTLTALAGLFSTNHHNNHNGHNGPTVCHALVEPDVTGTVAERSFVDHDLANVGETAYQKSKDLPEQAQKKLAAVEAKLGIPLGATRVDARSGRAAVLHVSVPLLPGNGVRNRLLWTVDSDGGASGVGGDPHNGHGAPHHRHLAEMSKDAVRGWMKDNEADLDIDVDGELFVGDNVRTGVHGPKGETIQIHMPRTYKGLTVTGSRAAATIVAGNLIDVAFEKWGDIPSNFDTEPNLTEEEAIQSLALYAGLELAGDGTEVTCHSELQILTLAKGNVPGNKGGTIRGQPEDVTQFGNGYKYTLAWKACPKFAIQGVEMMEGYVDAKNGRVLQLGDTNDYLYNAKGGVYPTTNDDVAPDGVEQPGWPMPFMEVAPNVFTDTGGNHEVTGQVTASLTGKYVNMNDNCGSSSLTKTDEDMDWGTSAGTDCTTPGFGGAGNTHSSRSGFYEIYKIKEIAMSRLPNNTWLKNKLTANMNINNTCNAFWNGSTINFYRSGGGCANTGEIAAVFDHEWGHGMDANDVVGGIASPSGEGIADLYSALRLDDSCIGRNFLSGNCSGNGDPCVACSGVRDIDYEKRQSGNPHTYTWSNANCGGSVHCVGGTYSEAVWSLYARVLREAPYNYGKIKSMEVVTRLTYIAAGQTSTWFSGGPPEGGCGGSSAYMNYLAADDDNGNLNDGTPHMTAIHKAFNDQEIACSTPTVQDSGCDGTPQEAPVVAVASGDRQVSLAWNAIAGATEYEVLRTEGVFQCGTGKVLLATVTGTTYTDSGLQNDREYYYNIIPKGSHPACYGTESECIIAIPVKGPFIIECASDEVTFFTNEVSPSTTRVCTVTSVGDYIGEVTMSCDESIGSISCTPSPPVVSFTTGVASVATVTLTVEGTGTTPGSGNIEVSGFDGLETRFAPPIPAGMYDPDFSIRCNSDAVQLVESGSSETRECEVTPFGYTGTVTIGCDASSIQDAECSVNPVSVEFTDTTTVKSTTVTITSTGTTINDGILAVTASDGAINKSDNSITVYVGTGGPQIAAYDAGMNAPRCILVGSSCSLPVVNGKSTVDGRGNLGPEANSPNTLDGCADGGSGTYHSDESLDSISVRAGTVSGEGSGAPIREGDHATITANVWAWSTGSSDYADFYYAADASSPNWQFIGTTGAGGGGARVLERDYIVPAGAMQAVRVSFRYSGSAAACSAGSYNDRDDLVFPVLPLPTDPTTSPTPAPTPSPTPAPTPAPQAPTTSPTPAPTPSPTPSPTPAPQAPTSSPTPAPTPSPTPSPTPAPTNSPTNPPTNPPTVPPTNPPTNPPTPSPTPAPTFLTGTNPGAVANNGVCEDGENCNSLGNSDCPGKTNGSPTGRYCCYGGPPRSITDGVRCSDSRCDTSGCDLNDAVDVQWQCPDGVCAGGGETYLNCPQDCDPPEPTTSPTPAPTPSGGGGGCPIPNPVSCGPDTCCSSCTCGNNGKKCCS